MTARTDTAITIRLATTAVPRYPAARSETTYASMQLLAPSRTSLRIADSAYVADPFFPSRALVGMLDTRAKAIRRATHSRVDRTRTRLSLWSALYNRASESRLML